MGISHVVFCCFQEISKFDYENIEKNKHIFKNDQKNWNENFVRIKKEQSFYKSFEMKKIKDKLFQTLH